MDDKLMQAIETIICAAMMQRSGARAIGTFMILTADTKYLGGDLFGYCKGRFGSKRIL